MTKVLKGQKKKKVRKRVATTTPPKAELDPNVFSFGPTPIQTAEDATMAYLREEITEDQLKTALARYGVQPNSLLLTRPERIDAAFKNNLPEEYFTYAPAVNPNDTFENRQAALAEKEAAREETPTPELTKSTSSSS